METREYWMQKIKASRYWKDRSWCTAYDLSKSVSGNEKTIAEYLRQMHRIGEADRREDEDLAGKPVIKWRPPVNQILRIPWRKTQPPQIYGCPTWR